MDMANKYAAGKDEYPEDITTAYSLIASYKTPENEKVQNNRQQQASTAAAATTTSTNTPETSAVTFAQKAAGGNKVAGTDGVAHDNVICYNCSASGHYANECPKATTDTKKAPTTTGATMTQFAYMLAQADQTDIGIDPNWILLDSQSTISVFRNKDMLSNIRDSGRTLRAFTNGGHQDSHLIGDFPNLGPVWYNSASIANILSLADVRRVCRVTMDSSNSSAIHVHRLDGSIMTFDEHPSGLYVYSANDDTSASVNAYTMISTISEQKKLFTRREIQSADEARELYRKIGRPSEVEFERILRNNLIHNCPVTPDDAKRALIIYGPDIATIKGKTTRIAAAAHVPTFVAQPIPAPILDHHRNITLCVDFFYVQGILFFHTISRDIGFRTVSLVKDRNKHTILRELKAVINIYTSRGLSVCDIHADSEFDCVREDLRPIALDIVPADSHVGEVERSIRTIKERLRSCVHGLPFKRLPKLLISEMVTHAARCLNQFPWINGVSSTLSPATIMLGTPPVDFNKLRVEFGSYVQVFEDNTPTNTPKDRSLGAIALTSTGNANGDFYFLSLASGQRISRHHWISVPMSDAAIARVEALGVADGQPLIQERGLVVEWRPDQPIDEYEYDEDFVLPPHPVDDDALDDAFDPIDPDELDALALVDPPVFVDPAPLPVGADQGAIDEVEDEVEFEDDDDDAVANDNEDIDADEQNNAVADDNEDIEEDANENGEEAGAGERNDFDAPLAGYNLRPRRQRIRFEDAIDNPHDGRSYYPPAATFIQSAVEEGSNTQPAAEEGSNTPNKLDDEMRKKIFAMVFTQMSANAGIKKHGKAAEEAMMEEYAQFELLRVYHSVHPDSLTKEQKKEALHAINLIKEKRDGRIKARTVANGRPQRDLYDKSETTSSTVSSDGLVTTIVIDAYENRFVATADVAGAYLKADMDVFTLMKFTGRFVDLVCKINPGHLKNVGIENGVKVLYVKLNKAIYGCVKSARLWYKVFSGYLVEIGFELNPYDVCVANSIIEGTQCTIAWYVDDMKVSHASADVVKSIIAKIEERFGKMTVNYGNEHSFLGMNIKYTGEGTAKITMKNYLQEAIDESGLEIKRTAVTPAKRCLFEVDGSSPALKKKEAEIFHSVVAKLLYVATRARMDILLAVGFLCTRVSKSTEQDREKLTRLLEYIKGTMDLEYTVGADSMDKLRTWVDASYAVHPDMRSHTGGVMSFGTGGIACKSSKQKLNTKSSTEAELVGASDYLPNTIWLKMFLEAQGYSISENYFEQDNQSAIKLEKNGRESAGPKSRHIDIRYFWIMDRVKDHGIEIRHCPTLCMLADFFTKPLQGSLFTQFRDVILGYKHIDSLSLPPTSTVEERVGEEDDRSVEFGTEKDEKEMNDTEDSADTEESDDDGFTTVVRKKRQKNSKAVNNSEVGKVVSKVILSKQSS